MQYKSVSRQREIQNEVIQMAETNGNGKEKAVELKSIFCEIYPDWQGDRVGRDFRFGDKVHKFSVGLPIPKTDEEAQDLYGTNLAYFVKKGVLQHSYDSDSNLGHKFVEALRAGTAADAMPAVVSETLEVDLIYIERERKTGEASELKAAKAELGMSLSEMIALAKKVKAGEIVA